MCLKGIDNYTGTAILLMLAVALFAYLQNA
jgi:hypothetical protein